MGLPYSEKRVQNVFLWAWFEFPFSAHNFKMASDSACDDFLRVDFLKGKSSFEESGSSGRRFAA